VKEGIQAHVSELAFQAVLRTETKQQASHYPHENVVFHAAQLQAETLSPQAPLKVNGEKTRTAQDVIFDRRHVDLFNQALQDPNHRLRRAAERAMQGFTMAADKPDGISASSASREFNAPTTFFLHWAKRYGAIPILKEGKGQGSKIILDREKAKKAAELYHEAKQQRIQPRKLLKRMSSS
jgi:hypothetical protein